MNTENCFIYTEYVSAQHFNLFERKINERFNSLQKSLERCHCRATYPSTTEAVVDFSFAGSSEDAKERITAGDVEGGKHEKGKPNSLL